MIRRKQIWVWSVLGLMLCLAPAATAQSGSADSQVSANIQDAEEDPGGDPKLNNDKLELGQMTWVAFRFTNVEVPQGATISSAYVEMRATDANSETTHLTISGQNSDNASSFGTNSNNVSSRSQTSASVQWHNVPNWQKNKWYQTPDLAGVIQEIVDRDGWNSGNALVILIRSDDLDGKRLAWAHDKAGPHAAKLHVEYDAGGGGGGGGLLAHWKLDETSGQIAYDSSGNDHHGTLMHTGASPEWTSGRLDGALELDGFDDYIEVSSLPDLTGSLTILAWVRINSADGDQRIFGDDKDNGGYALSIGDGGDGRVRFFGRGVSPVPLDTGPVIQPGVWHFVAAVHDVTSKTRRIYVDGVLAAEDFGSYASAWVADSGEAGIGGEVDGSPEATPNWRLGGRLDDVRLYDLALTSAEIEEIRLLAPPVYRLILWSESQPSD